jgi:hypothetical protein
MLHFHKTNEFIGIFFGGGVTMYNSMYVLHD